MDKITNKVFGIPITRSSVAIIMLTVLLVLIVYSTGLNGTIYLLLSIVVAWSLTTGFLVDRRYAYTLALIFLVLCPILLVLKMDNIAEYLAILSYLCLALGVLKDIFYEKIIEE